MKKGLNITRMLLLLFLAFSVQNNFAQAATVNGITAAPTALAQTFSAGSTVADLVAQGTDLQWYDVAKNGSALEASTALATGTYYVSQTLNGRESARTATTAIVSTTTLSVPTATHSNQVLAYKQGDTVSIDAGSIIMTGIKVYDLNGRLLLERKNINANQFGFSIAKATDLLLIKMTSNDGQLITKKIIN